MGHRTVSNVPAQALILMNAPFVIEQAGLWASRVLADQALAPQQRVVQLYQAAFSRTPGETELADALKFIDDQAARYGFPREQRFTSLEPWKDLCHVMFTVKEFIFVH